MSAHPSSSAALPPTVWVPDTLNRNVKSTSTGALDTKLGMLRLVHLEINGSGKTLPLTVSRYQATHFRGAGQAIKGFPSVFLSRQHVFHLY